MDAIDRGIIAELQADGRMTTTDLAKRVGLSLSATGDRLRQLRRSGVISGFTVRLDPAAAGHTIDALVDVRMAPHVDQDRIDDQLSEFPAIIDALHLTGRFDMQLRVSAPDVATLDRLLVALKEQLGAEETNTRLVLRQLRGFPRGIAV